MGYFGLQGHLDYEDIWTIAVWTTMTNFLLGDASLPFDASNIRKDHVGQLGLAGHL